MPTPKATKAATRRRLLEAVRDGAVSYRHPFTFVVSPDLAAIKNAGPLLATLEREGLIRVKYHDAGTAPDITVSLTPAGDSALATEA